MTMSTDDFPVMFDPAKISGNDAVQEPVSDPDVDGDESADEGTEDAATEIDDAANVEGD